MIDPTQTLVTIGTTIATTLAAKGIEAPGKTLGQIWDIAIGNRIAAVYEKSKAKHNLNVEDFKSKLINNVSSIPKENIQDPKVSIIGPALEASKYYFDEKEIRDMFANLIASSMDSSYNGLVQHSFVEIIKQLSPYDAIFFKNISGFIQAYDLKEDNSIFFRCFSILPDFLDYEVNAISINNLHRLGLLDLIPYFSIENNPYKNFIENSTYIKEFEKKHDKFSMQSHAYIVSPLGRSFKKVCIKGSL